MKWSSVLAIPLVLFGTGFLGAKSREAQLPPRDFRLWTLEESVQLLTRSPWARQETFTRLIGGIGSGLMGEKEIYNTFFVRFLSARPIREAFARVGLIQQGYDNLPAHEKREIERDYAPGIDLDFSEWIVVAVSFRSNDRNLENRVHEFLHTQTAETLRNRAFLSTLRNGPVSPAAYFAPLEDEVGAKFVFPRFLDGVEVVRTDDLMVTFELDIPGASPELRTTFLVADMIVNGDLEL